MPSASQSHPPHFQQTSDKRQIFECVDAHWARYPHGKSCSVAVLLIFECPINSVSKAQSVITIPPAESELYKIGKGSLVAIQISIIPLGDQAFEQTQIDHGGGLFLGKSNCDHLRSFQEDSTHSTSTPLHAEALPEGDHESSKNCWRARNFRRLGKVCQDRDASSIYASLHHGNCQRWRLQDSAHLRRVCAGCVFSACRASSCASGCFMR